MDYKKKYEESLERCKKEFNFNNLAYSHEEIKQRLEYIFPELKQSKNDRMINFISHELACLRASDDKGSDRYNELTEAITWLEKQGEQKPINKVEPKFKVGDWITDGLYTVFQIIGIEEEWCIADDGDRICLNVVNQYYHLWTIQDAKNGDILQANKCTLIFDSLTKDIDDNTVISSWYFCDTKTFYGMGTCKPDLWTIEGVVPATKEQRNLLFSKMKEAGYEWDAEKKELKKIEYKHTEWSEEDDEWMKSTFDKLSIGKDMCLGEKHWIQSLKERMKGE